LGKAIRDKESQIIYLKERLNMFMGVLDSIDPEHTAVEDVDRLLEMIDEIEVKCEQFNKK
jgi:hypothetical protein